MSAIGLRVGPFEISDEVVVPATGSWYRAHRTGLTRRRPVDVLVRLLGPAPSSRDLADVQHQFDTLRSLDDRRFPKPVALYEGTGALALDVPPGLPVSRIVEGRVLGDLSMTPATLLDLALELVEAIGHAHQKGHHHGHLSADNVTMSGDGAIWIWGIGDRSGRPPFAWVAPERARGEAATAATDQWSLGALVVALVTGRTPWAPTAVDVDPRSGDVEAFVAPVARQWPALGRLARRMLDPNPSLRFPSLHPVRLELLALARRAGGASDRRVLGAWLHRSFGNHEDVDKLDEIEVTGNAPIAPIPVQVEVEDDAPPDPSDTRITAAPMTVAAPRRPEPRDEGPRIDSAPRVAVDPTRRPGRSEPLPSERIAVVRPAGFEDEVDDRPPPVRARTPESEAPTDPDHVETEMVEDFVLTEMVDETPAVRIAMPPTPEASTPEPIAPAPIAPAPIAPTPIMVTIGGDDPATLPPADGPAGLRVSPTPHYRADPVPTLPGMDAPEIRAIGATPLPAPVVMFEIDDDDDDDFNLLTEDALLVDDDDLFADEPERVQAVPELDDDFFEPLTDDGPGMTVVPFTNPDFVGPSITMRAPERPPDEVDTDAGPRWTLPIDVDAPPPETELPLDVPDPRTDPIVRLAPWLGSGAIAALALLLVINVLI
jgi:hypothetical protein